MDASIAQAGPGCGAAGEVPAADLEDALFDGLRRQVESMISWGKSDDALALEHDQLESRTLAGGFEAMRIFTEAHLGLRAARESRRADVTDADGDARTTAEDGQEHTRVMLYGPVRTSRIAYKRYRKPNLYPQDADLNWAVLHSFSAGVVMRVARASGIVPFEQAAAQVSAAGAITAGKRQAEELAVGSVTDFEAFYAARLPEPCPAGTGLLITADGSAFPVLPGALRPATPLESERLDYRINAICIKLGKDDDSHTQSVILRRTTAIASLIGIVAVYCCCNIEATVNAPDWR